MNWPLARKYRPRRFDEVVGQEHITMALRNAFRKNRIGQAYLFHGPRGTGKTTCARILARVLNCENPSEAGEPCLSCASCQTFDEGRSVNIYELDAASNSSVDDVRALIEQVNYPPSSGQYKVYIIDEVHMLSQSAFNAFLKTLEEPPAHVVFILATTEKQRILPTILSRCQVFDFRRVAVTAIVNRLDEILRVEGITFSEEALYAIAEQADGIMRDALTIADRVVSGTDGELTAEAVYRLLGVPPATAFFELWNAIVSKDIASALKHVSALLDAGYDEGLVFKGLRWHIRHLLMASDPATQDLIQLPPSVKDRMVHQSQRSDPMLLVNALHVTSEMEGRLMRSLVPRLHLETAILKLIYLQDIVYPMPIEPEDREALEGKRQTAPFVPSESVQSSLPIPKDTANPQGPSFSSSSSPANVKTPTDRKKGTPTDPTSWKSLWEGFQQTVTEGPLQQVINTSEVTFTAGKKVVIWVDPGWSRRVQDALDRYLLRHARKGYQWQVVEREHTTAQQLLETLVTRYPAVRRLHDELGLTSLK